MRKLAAVALAALALAFAPATASATAPANTSPPVVTGTARQGQTLSTSNGAWTGTVTSYKHSWYDCNGTCKTISGAVSRSYVLQASDVGFKIRSGVKACNTTCSAVVKSAATAVVTASSGGCDVNATPSNFSAQVAAATAGQTVCLASGSYGMWTGTAKAITVTAASGATPTMTISFASGASGFTLSRMSGMSGTINASAHDITVSNSTFTDTLDMSGLQNANILLDHDSFDNMNEASTCLDEPARIHLSYSGGSIPSGVTVQNSEFVDPAGGLSNPKDGIQTGSGMVVRDNLFEWIHENGGCNHADAIQGVGAQGVVVQGNLFANDSDGFVDFDDSTGDTATDNACYGLARNACVTLYADLNSTAEHNTGGSGMRSVELDAKSGHRNGSGTIVRNNVGPVSINNSSPAIYTNNLFSGATSPNINGSPIFAGGSSPTTWSGFELAPGSLGIGAATDGSDVGIRASVGGPVTAQSSSQPVGDPLGRNWTPVFGDEFNGTSIDSSKWTSLNFWYLNNANVSPADCSEGGGNLILSLPGDGTGCDLATAQNGLDSYGLPIGGYLEARIWFPGPGSTPTSTIDNFPAFWALGTAPSGGSGEPGGEIDIAEGINPLEINYHSDTVDKFVASPAGQWGNSWHVYGVYRGATQDQIFWDGIQVATVTTADNGSPESIMLTSGETGGCCGGPVQHGPAGDVLIDWVRAWG